MSTRSLAESVILQAIEDMCADRNEQGEALEYFLGDHFRQWALIAGMEKKDQHDLLRLLGLPTKKKKITVASKRRPSQSSRNLVTASACL